MRTLIILSVLLASVGCDKPAPYIKPIEELGPYIRGKMADGYAKKGVNMFRMDSINVPVLGIVENMAYFTPEELPSNKYYIFGKEGAKNLRSMCMQEGNFQPCKMMCARRKYFGGNKKRLCTEVNPEFVTDGTPTIRLSVVNHE